MTAQLPTPRNSVYVITLHAAEAGQPARLSGRLEHVPSGRRHDFDNGPALLACLAHEQAQVAQAAATPVVPTRPDPQGV